MYLSSKLIKIDLDIILEFVFEPNSTLKVSSWDEGAKPHHNSLELRQQSHINVANQLCQM